MSFQLDAANGELERRGALASFHTYALAHNGAAHAPSAQPRPSDSDPHVSEPPLCRRLLSIPLQQGYFILLPASFLLITVWKMHVQ